MMVYNNTPYASMLELVEQRIEQMDAFNPRDASDLDALLHCRESLKVVVSSGSADDRDRYVDTLRKSALALGDLSLIEEVLAPCLDVV